MDFKRAVSRKSSIRPVHTELSELYPHELQLYENPPTFEVTLAEFEQSAAERLAVLQTIDEVNSRGLKGDEWRKTILEELKKQDLRGFTKLITCTSLGNEEADFAMRRRDHISHFILRLAYCDSEDKRKWFMAREIDLFRLRWMFLRVPKQTEFIKINKLNYEIVGEEEKRELINLSGGMISSLLDYFKINFVYVSDLVRMRKVFLSKGIAYITHEDIISVILSSYRSNLSECLAYAGRRIHILSEDSRIQGIIKGAGKSQREVDYTAYLNKEKINIKNIDALAEMSYPLCMQRLHERLRQEHHLKHSARQQYGLFLKGIGVTLEDALRFWRTEFSKKMDSDKFEKSYAYNIRHNYGKEGKRANYAPQNCLKIINGSVAPGDYHGCPFKHVDPVTLKKMVEKNGLSFTGVEEVVNLAKKGHFQIACSTYFQHKHNSSQMIINHPNLYFDESQKILCNKAVKKEEKGTAPTKRTAPSTPASQQTPSSKKVNQSTDVWEDMDIDFSNIGE